MKRVKISKYIAILILILPFVSCKQKTSVVEPYKVFNNHIQLEGEDNMRDLGGLIGKDGKRVLYRKLFRSGKLNELTTSDKDSLLKIGIEQVIDLRTVSEREEDPDKIPDGIPIYDLPLQKNGIMKNLGTRILTKQIDSKELLLEAYREIDSLKITNWKKIFDHLENNKTTLWHCSAGKDRAGMTTVLVLSSLGVKKDDIIKDYMKSNDYLSAYNKNFNVTLTQRYGKEAAELFWPLLNVEQEYIEVFLNTINKKYGGMEKYLEVLDVDVQKMQENYLEK